MTDERTGTTDPTASRMLKQIDQPKFVPVLYVLEFTLPHPLERAI